MDKQEISKRLSDIRTGILIKYPFYGNLLMSLKMSLANCGTAATDMTRIIWDPNFVERLSDEEIEFVMLHEVMHCVLSHCTRNSNLSKRVHNIAADIVVNSIILHEIQLDEFSVDGVNAMHITPLGDEGRLHTTEEVYELLMKMARSKDAGEGDGTIDNHGTWNISGDNKAISENEWRERIKAAASACPGDMPSHMKRIIDSVISGRRIDWRTVLHEFIQVVCDKKDFSFNPYDKRFQDTGMILPAFTDEMDEKVSGLWFVVDVSGSMSDEIVSEIISEIKSAASSFESFQAKLSFFDTDISEPMSFDSAKDLDRLTVNGNGGTHFDCIFKYMQKEMMYDMPTGIVVLTDGYGFYPKESEAMDVPVLWILTEGEEDAPWGRTVRM